MDVYLSQFERTYYGLTGSGKAPWMREGPVERGPAYNPYGGVVFKGLNGVMLDMAAAARGFRDPRWLSLHEAEFLGLTLRHGERPVAAAYTRSVISRNSYYLLCNLEQFKEYPRMPERDAGAEREAGRERLRAVLEHTGAGGFTGVLEKVDRETEREGGLTRAMARYRLCQECHECYIPPAGGEAGMGKGGIALIRSVYYAEKIKDRLMTRGRDERDRTVELSRRREAHQL
jgi:hypothetical protein